MSMAHISSKATDMVQRLLQYVILYLSLMVCFVLWHELCTNEKIQPASILTQFPLSDFNLEKSCKDHKNHKTVRVWQSLCVNIGYRFAIGKLRMVFRISPLCLPFLLLKFQILFWQVLVMERRGGQLFSKSTCPHECQRVPLYLHSNNESLYDFVNTITPATVLAALVIPTVCEKEILYI